MEGVVVESTAYEELHRAVTKMAEHEITGHRVIWEAEDGWKHPTTEYVVKNFDEHLGEPTLLIWGHGGDKDVGGKYEIIPKPNDEAWLRHHYPDGQTRDGKLERLVVFSPDFAYETVDDKASFWRNPFENLKEIKNRT